MKRGITLGLVRVGVDSQASSVSLRILDQGTLIFNCVLVICRCKEQWCRIARVTFTQLALQYHYQRDSGNFQKGYSKLHSCCVSGQCSSYNPGKNCVWKNRELRLFFHVAGTD